MNLQRKYLKNITLCFCILLLLVLTICIGAGCTYDDTTTEEITIDDFEDEEIDEVLYDRHGFTIEEAETALSENEELTNENENLEEEVCTLEEDNTEKCTELSWHEENIVFVTTTGSKFHKRNCQHIQDAGLYAMFYETAESEGYEPCLDCNPPNTAATD